MAFENGFESLMDIMQAEDYSEGGMCVCLYACMGFIHIVILLYCITASNIIKPYFWVLILPVMCVCLP